MPAMEKETAGTEPPHFLIVTYPAQGHINPARHLARRLLRTHPGARVTVSTAVSAHRRMFPGASSADKEGHGHGQGQHRDAAGVWYAPYSDGYDDGFDRAVHDHTHYMAQIKAVGSRTVAGLIDALRPTLVAYTLLLSWVADVARGRGVPCALYWIQPATALAAYVHFFRGTDGVDEAVAAAAKSGDPWAAVDFPGLPPLRVRDLPSFITITSDDDPYAFVVTAFRELVEALDRCDEDDRPTTVLANTFDAMEPEAVASLRRHGVDVVPIGPVLSFLDDATPSAAAGAKDDDSNDLFRQDGKGYLEWLDAQADGSVVYVSFGSLSTMSERQIQEVARGMEASGRPFLWVLRKDNRTTTTTTTTGEDDDASPLAPGGERGMVVEWCDQVRVLSQRAVGCFVTHCGWNSTLESVACGVPVVAVPQWTDQGTNAWIVAERLGAGVRADVSEKDGVIEADELTRCVAFATSDAVRAKAAVWSATARAATAEGGSSERNLRSFVARQLLALGGGGGGN